MTPPHLRRLAGLLLAASAASAAAACRAPVRTVPAATAGPAATAMGDAAAIERARADSVRLPWVEADADFMTAMIGHHAQAIVMARLAPTRGASPAVQRLAERIINAQEDEIGTMQRWLRDRRRPAPEVPADGGAAAHAAMGHGAAHGSVAPAAGHEGHAGHAMGASMPGMLTDAQLRELGAARGREFDRLFLTSMIRHHRGAVAMVERLFGTYGAGQDETVFRFATDVNVDQNTEIARMERMLAELILVEP